MSDFDVYEGEMTQNRFSDQDIERFFSGDTPEDEALARLAVHVGAWYAVYERDPSDEKTTAFAAEAAEIAASMTPTAVPRAVPAAAVSPFTRVKSALRQKLATGLAAVLLLSGMTGIAVAANNAAPGDALYDIDQTLETFGILDGGAEERIAEAQSLFNDGLVAEAISHAAEAVAQTGDAEGFSPESAREALENAADSVLANGDQEGDLESDDVREAVHDMLDWMSMHIGVLDDPATDPEAFGQGVAEWASKISGDINAADNAADAAENAAEEAKAAQESAGDAGPPVDVPTGPPVDTPAGP